MSVEIQTTEDVVITSTEGVIVELKSAEDIQSNATVSVEAKVNKWTVLGDDIYIANQTSTLPLWFQSLLDAYLSNNTTLATNVSDLTNTFQNFQTGYTQQIGLINDNLSTLSYDLSTNYVSKGTFNAGIQSLDVAKVDSTQATAIAQNTIGAWQIDPLGGGAWFNSKISTYSNTLQSVATSVSSLNAQYNGLNVSVQDISLAYIDGNGYKIGSSRMAMAPDGSVVGWEFVDGSNQYSDFTIYAQNFKIADGTNKANVPFSIVAGTPNKIKFDGIVDFTNTNIANGYAGTTTINGGLITTNSIWLGGTITSSDFVPFTTGFRLKANAAGTTDDPTIYGAYIKGATLEAANIISPDIVKTNTYRNTTAVAFSNTSDIFSTTLNLTETRKVVIQIDTDYYFTMPSYPNPDIANYVNTKEYKIDLLIDGVVKYSSHPSTLQAVLFGTDWYFMPGIYSHSKSLPSTHTYIETLNSGSHNITWRLVQTNATGDPLTINYTLRSAIITDYKI